jgi:hypothetical protein
MENGLIRELWSAMAQDVSGQISCLKAFPPSFWKQLQKDQDGLNEAATQTARLQITDKTEDLPLKRCFELALQLEEPMILKIYGPIVRSLRENGTNPAMDFYIIVKAHLARILRAMESFSGDPLIMQRSALLLQSFEKEVQEPQVELPRPVKKIRAARPARRKVQVRKKKQASIPVRPMAKRAKVLHTRTARLLKKVSLQRRRARR